MCIWSLFTTQLSLYAIVFKRIFWNNPTAETCVHMLTRERWVEKSVLRYVRTKWMAADKCCGMFLCIGTAKYIKPSPSARKMSLFSSIIIAIFFILCDNSNLHNFNILHNFQTHELRLQIHKLPVQIYEFENHQINENSSKKP